jgi:hypothetical protein
MASARMEIAEKYPDDIKMAGSLAAKLFMKFQGKFREGSTSAARHKSFVGHLLQNETIERPRDMSKFMTDVLDHFWSESEDAQGDAAEDPSRPVGRRRPSTGQLDNDTSTSSRQDLESLQAPRLKRASSMSDTRCRESGSTVSTVLQSMTDRLDLDGPPGSRKKVTGKCPLGRYTFPNFLQPQSRSLPLFPRCQNRLIVVIISQRMSNSQ